MAEDECGALLESANDTFNDIEAPISWTHGEQAMALEDPHDQYNYRLEARKKIISINMSAIPIMHWEAFFINPGSMPGIPFACNIPPEALKDHLLVGDSALKILGYVNGKVPSLTISQMIKMIGRRQKDLLGISRFFDMETTHLYSHVQEKAEHMVHGLILAELPRDVYKSEAQVRCVLPEGVAGAGGLDTGPATPPAGFQK